MQITSPAPAPHPERWKDRPLTPEDWQQIIRIMPALHTEARFTIMAMLQTLKRQTLDQIADTLMIERRVLNNHLYTLESTGCVSVTYEGADATVSPTPLFERINHQLGILDAGHPDEYTGDNRKVVNMRDLATPEQPEADDAEEPADDGMIETELPLHNGDVVLDPLVSPRTYIELLYDIPADRHGPDEARMMCTLLGIKARLSDDEWTDYERLAKQMRTGTATDIVRFEWLALFTRAFGMEEREAEQMEEIMCIPEEKRTDAQRALFAELAQQYLRI